MCDVLDVSVSGYRAWRRGGTPNRKRLTDSPMRALIRALHAELKGVYGSPRRVQELRARDFSARKERIERLMLDNGYQGSSQAAHQGNDGLQTRSAGSRQSARQELYAGGTRTRSGRRT